MSVAAQKNLPGVTVPGYFVDALIFDGDPTRIYRAKRESDGLPVMLKTLDEEQIASDAGACLRHEFEIAKRFQAPSVIQVYGLETYRNTPVIVMEDFGGDSLNNLAKEKRFSLEEILQIAIGIAKGLGEIHGQNIIHKDITPSNIVYNPDSGELKIIDFGISSYLTREQAAIASPKTVQANLPYISPEQTGRMNRSVDFRSDYYSFGATLYELLTGHRLFDVKDAIEWFHCHIARQPVSVHQRNSGVPEMVSAIVMKLLEKMAEDRYQSSWGIQADLQECLDQLRQGRQIREFELAKKDTPNRFQIPQRLYGREQEVKTLLACFDRIRSGRNEMILVSGYSGIGKTCLIKEIYKPITERRGHFISGKFDQLHRNIPYSALVFALKDLVKQLLSETEEQLQHWKKRILEGLGGNGRLITNFIHELELIIGPQPALPDLPAMEAEQRFHRVFHNFIQLFASDQHPMVLFLDDLQWADNASLRVMALLVGRDTAADNLLIIGSYRDNEVSATHPLQLMLKDLHDDGVEYDELRLEPLNLECLEQLVAETLGSDQASVKPLAQLVEQKTAGNPFFTEEFLKFLFNEGLIHFDHENGCWRWDLARIQSQNMTDNVVELMTDKLNLLPEPSLALLKVAACIGNRFSLNVLSVVSELRSCEVATHLRAAMAEGIVAPLGNAYQLVSAQANVETNVDIEFAFAHDRIQQAAYSLLDASHRGKTHLRIGRLLQQWLTQEKQREQIFEIVNHLNFGFDYIDDQCEKNKLCALNLEAGKRAKASTAYQAAIAYFEVALRTLPHEVWQKNYSDAMDLYLEAAEACALNLEFDRMSELLNEGFARSQNLLDEARLNLVLVSALQTQGKLKEAVKTGKVILAKLGHVYPKNTNKLHVILKLLRVAWRMHKVDIDDLHALPMMTDSHHLIAHSIGAQIARAAMFVEPQLLPVMVLHSILVQMKYGHAPDAVSSWGAYGMVVAVELGRPERGMEYGELSIELADKHNLQRVKAKVIHVYNAMIRHWKEPLHATLEPLIEAYRAGLDNGDFEYASLAIAVRQFNAYYTGQNLTQWGKETLAYQEAVRQLKQGMTSDYLDLSLQLWENLTGNADNPKKLVGQYYDVEAKQAQHMSAGDISFMVINTETSIWLHYLFGDHSEALKLVRNITAEAGSFGGFYRAAVSSMVESLVLLANLNSVESKQRHFFLKRISRNQKNLKKWAHHCPANFKNKFILVEAEILRRKGQSFEANDLYEKSMELAAEQGIIQEQALAAELCGEMHRQSGRNTLADPYLLQARDLYAAWGAKAKVDQMLQRYPQLIRSVRKSEGTTSTNTIASFDITALTKALKAIADEQIHGRMIKAIIESAVEFASAQRGLLILRNADNQLCVEAEFSVENGISNSMQSLALEQQSLPLTLLNYVIRSHESVVIHDAQQPSTVVTGLEVDTYIQSHRVRSLLCLPIVSGSDDQNALIGIIYLENNLASGTFTQERFDTLEIIGMAAAGRLELSRKAAFDGLTGLFNHEYFQNMLSQEISAAHRYDRELALLLIDIDHFKQFNDSWGHQVGDQVLKDVAQLIKSTCRNCDVVARYGGEEMVVIFPSTSKVDAADAAERIRHAVEQHRVHHEGHQLTVTISSGLALLDSEEEKDALIRRADEALYRSKENGRNQVTLA